MAVILVIFFLQMKKLRDSLGMKEICSYYIKTLFYNEIMKKKNPYFWHQNESVVFKCMVKKLYNALCTGNIPYYWHEQNNLIKLVPKKTLDEYKGKLEGLLKLLNNDAKFKYVATYILTKQEFNEYNKVLRIARFPEKRAAKRNDKILQKTGTHKKNKTEKSRKNTSKKNNSSHNSRTRH